MFYVCLDKIIKKQTCTKLNLSSKDRFICLDSSLDDSHKTNISMICKLEIL